MYVNGIQEGFPIYSLIPLKSGLSSLVVGARGTDFETKFIGVMKEIRIWHASKSSEFVSFPLSRLDLAGNESGLAGWWKLDSPCLHDVVWGYCAYRDLSSYNNHLILHYVWNNLEKESWEYCCFAHGILNDFQPTKEKYSKENILYLTDIEKGIFMHSELVFPFLPLAVQFCASIATNHVKSDALIQASLDVKFNDGSFLLDQSMTFETGTHDYQRQCIVVQGLNPIVSLMVVLVSDNKPDPLPPSFSKKTSFNIPQASWIKVKDISLRPLTLPALPEILSYSIYVPSIPIRFDMFLTEPFFFKSENIPVIFLFLKLKKKIKIWKKKGH